MDTKWIFFTAVLIAACWYYNKTHPTVIAAPPPVHVEQVHEARVAPTVVSVPDEKDRLAPPPDPHHKSIDDLRNTNDHQ